MNLEELRTAMAKERTKLAWIRTSLTSFIAGISSWKLIDGTWQPQVLGWGFVVLAGILVVRGMTKRFE